MSSAAAEFSRPCPKNGCYDVFLSFRGADTRYGFTDNLYHSLMDNKVYTFMDIKLVGKVIDSLFEIIERSKMAVVVYSESFAASDWCLRELDMIVQRMKKQKMLMIPIFYKVKVHELKHLTGNTGKYLDAHIQEHGETTVKKWKDAVTTLGHVSGLFYGDSYERDFIAKVIEIVKEMLQEREETVGSSFKPHYSGHAMEQDKVGILHVKVLRATELSRKDPYVKLKLMEDKLSKKTTVKHSNVNPEWNEEFYLVVKDPESQALAVTCYDWVQVGKHVEMGMNVIPLKDLTPGEPIQISVKLLKNMDPNDLRNEKHRGELFIELLYKPFKEDQSPVDEEEEDSNSVQKAPEGTPATGGLLVVIVYEATDVAGKHHTNPYARLLLRGDERITKSVKKNRDPRWDEEFLFLFDEPPTNDRIHIEVHSASSMLGILHPRESLGYVDIPLSDVVHNKRINRKYSLLSSENGKIQIELQWRTSS